MSETDFRAHAIRCDNHRSDSIPVISEGVQTHAQALQNISSMAPVTNYVGRYAMLKQGCMALGTKIGEVVVVVKRDDGREQGRARHEDRSGGDE